MSLIMIKITLWVEYNKFEFENILANEIGYFAQQVIETFAAQWETDRIQINPAQMREFFTPRCNIGNYILIFWSLLFLYMFYYNIQTFHWSVLEVGVDVTEYSCLALSDIIDTGLNCIFLNCVNFCWDWSCLEDYSNIWASMTQRQPKWISTSLWSVCILWGRWPKK